jgi:ubiquinone/menaquinone biosynthesis C-methylase UbiE
VIGPALRSARNVFVSAALLAAVAVSATFAQNNASDASKLIDVLQLKPGSTVAEIGAGGADLTIAIAKHVGPLGRVYTSELGAERLTKLRETVSKSGLANITVIEGHEAHANLPDGCCDAVFMRNVYHHFADPKTMNASLLRALKPGARVAVIDFSPRTGAAVAPPGKRGDDAAHGVNVQVVSSELKAAGFQIVTSEDRGERWFLVVGARPN